LLIFLINCDYTTKPNESENSLITDYIQLSYDCDYLDTLRVLDVDFTYIYHSEGIGFQLFSYSYILRDIRTGIGYGSFWEMGRKRSPINSRGELPILSFYTDCNILDTLNYSRLVDISKRDTFYQRFEFTLKGFFSDSSFSDVEDTLNLESFEYSYIDTILIVK